MPWNIKPGYGESRSNENLSWNGEKIKKIELVRALLNQYKGMGWKNINSETRFKYYSNQCQIGIRTVNRQKQKLEQKGWLEMLLIIEYWERTWAQDELTHYRHGHVRTLFIALSRKCVHSLRTKYLTHVGVGVVDEYLGLNSWTAAHGDYCGRMRATIKI